MPSPTMATRRPEARRSRIAAYFSVRPRDRCIRTCAKDRTAHVDVHVVDIAVPASTSHARHAIPTAIASRGFRLTGPRRAVVDVLVDRGAPVSPKYAPD
jgi:hypothetical protein